MSRRQGFTLIELLVVIAVIAVLMGIMMPGLRAAKQLAAGSACLANEKTLLTAWFLYADDFDGKLVSNNACYDTTQKNDETAWVYQPRNPAGLSLPRPAPAADTARSPFANGQYRAGCWSSARASRRTPPAALPAGTSAPGSG